MNHHLAEKARTAPRIASLVVIAFVFLVSTNAYSADLDTIFIRSGSTYTGWILEYKPDVSVSILTETDEAFVVDWKNITRVARQKRSSGEVMKGPASRGRKPLENADRPPLVWIITPYLDGFLTPTVLSLAFESSGLIGYGLGISGDISLEIARVKYIGISVDYREMMFQNGIDRSSDRTGSGRSWAIGASIAYDAMGFWIMNSVSYVRQDVDWNYPSTTPDEIRNTGSGGLRIQFISIMPVSSHFGLHVGANCDLLERMQLGLKFGFSFSNFMHALHEAY